MIKGQWTLDESGDLRIVFTPDTYGRLEDRRVYADVVLTCSVCQHLHGFSSDAMLFPILVGTNQGKGFLLLLDPEEHLRIKGEQSGLKDKNSPSEFDCCECGGRFPISPESWRLIKEAAGGAIQAKNAASR